MSHPSRVRELKREDCEEKGRTTVSHPSRVRELKHLSAGDGIVSVSRRTPPGCVN